MAKSIKLGFLSFLLARFLLPATPIPDDPSLQAMETIRSADLRSNLYFLASDEMQGRNINTLSNKITSHYLAHRFELMGLRPVAIEDGYFQYFDLVQSELSDANRLEIHLQDSTLPTTALLHEDFYPCRLSPSRQVTAPLVFVGYGITAPEKGYDDYQGVDVRGKMVLLMTHEPGEENADSPFDGLVISDYGRELHKILNAQERGAVGAIIVKDPVNHSGPENFEKEARSTWPEQVSQSRPTLQVWADQVQIPAVHASRKIAAALLQPTHASLEEIQTRIDRDYRPHGFPVTGVRATLETAVIRNETRVRNVLAYLPGSDPALKSEVVILGAHFDHVGVRDGEVYPGADDDGSGTAGLLEIAEAFTLNPSLPRRSILFAGWNAEEQGLLGSYYYVARPSFPLAKTVAMFQMDMIGRNEEVPDPNDRRFRGLQKQTAEQNANALNILGFSRSNDLRQLVSRSNERIGLELKFRYDNHQGNLLRRSDHWPFLNQGVPALFFHTGLHPDYHRPGDTADKIDYPKMERIVRLVFLCSWRAANTTVPPRLDPSKGP